MSLKGQVAVVTGGSRGIGRAICLRLAEEGCDVIVNYHTSRQKAEEVVSAIRKTGRKAFAVKADVSRMAQAQKLARFALQKFGRIDILVNNAGVYSGHLLTALSEQEWDRVIRINLKSMFNCCKSTVEFMVKQKAGNIVNVSSINGKQGFPGDTHYSASKAGVIGFTMTLAKELAEHNIRVNAVAPGEILTDMTVDDVAKNGSEYLKQIPLGRFGKPEEVAAVVAFLVSDDASYITGETINVNGGWFMD